ncbi:hypothetical protein [Glaciihabitans sp. UYNi722]|uniref:hypothetical protein n=1 Tax=Glaciihabitans sp. UYNi722 TaxID=3156344 RepID=UPI00339180E7
MMRSSRAVSVLFVAIVGLTLVGCVSDPGYSDLDRKATSEDALPSTLPGYASDGMDVDSARLVGTYDGVELYLARGKVIGVCLLTYGSDQSWLGACGGSGLTTSNDDYEIRIVETNTDKHPGWTKVGENLLAREKK